MALDMNWRRELAGRGYDLIVAAESERLDPAARSLQDFSALVERSA